TCLTNLGVPSAALYASMIETAICKEKIFEEIAIGFLKVLYITPEKVELNQCFQIFLDKLYQEKKLQLVIDEAHCILSYQHFQGAWGRLGFLKKQYPTVPLLLLTVTVSSAHIEAIHKTPNLEQSNFEIIHSTNLLHKEIQYEVISKKDRKDTIIGDMAKIIHTIKDDIYHGGLDSKDKKHILEKWEDTELIQLSGHAGYPVHEAYLQTIQKDLFKVIAFCAIQYDCRQQFLCKYLWPELSSSYYECNNCDNCQRRNEENPQLINALSEILEILEVVEALTKNNLMEVSSDDVIDVFSRSNTDKIRKNRYNELILQRDTKEVKLYEEKPPTILVPKEIARIALNDLVCKDLVKQEIRLQQSKITQYLSCNTVVTGISENAKKCAEKECWEYWVYSRKGKKQSK
ncbi:15046_t:CDS:2, partial [Racocetra persica]